MAIIKSGVTTDEMTVDPTSKAARVTMYRSDGTEVVNHVPVEIAVSQVTAVDNDIIASFDVSPYSYLSLQLTGTWVGAVRFQASNDNGTFQDIVVQNVGDIVEPYKIEATTNSLVKIPVLAKYLRVRVTAYTSGIVNGACLAHEEDVHTGQISSTGEVTIASNQTLATLTNLEQLGGQAISMNTGIRDTGTQRVTIATDDAISLATGSEVSFATPTTLSNHLFISVAGAVTVNDTSISANPTILKSLVVTNNTATARHLKIYNTAVTPVAGVGTPVFIVTLTASGTIAYPIAAEGQFFSAGIGMTMTLGVANSDTTPPTTSGDMSAVFQYT